MRRDSILKLFQKKKTLSIMKNRLPDLAKEYRAHRSCCLFECSREIPVFVVGKSAESRAFIKIHIYRSSPYSTEIGLDES